jgi:hypothetical protein
MDTNERYQRAQARVKQLRDFYTHVGVYVCVNIFLLALNLLTSPHARRRLCSLSPWLN